MPSVRCRTSWCRSSAHDPFSCVTSLRCAAGEWDVPAPVREDRSVSAEGDFIQTRNLRSASVNQALQGAQIKSLRKRSDAKPKGALASFASGLSRRTFRFARPIKTVPAVAVEGADPMADPRNVLKERMLEDRKDRQDDEEDGQEGVAFEEADGVNPDGAGKAFFRLKAFATGTFAAVLVIVHCTAMQVLTTRSSPSLYPFAAETRSVLFVTNASTSSSAGVLQQIFGLHRGRTIACRAWICA